MAIKRLGGYTSKILRIDVEKRTFSEESFDEETLRDYIGGVGIGIKVLLGKFLQEFLGPMGKMS